MLFHTFSSQAERREFGGSYFIELQYCKLAQNTAMEKIVSVSAIEHWKDDSLYIYGDDDNTFVTHYGNIFTGGIYNNQKSGAVDLCGINYYSRERAYLIMRKTAEQKPPNYQTLLNWLEKVRDCTGFYVLGL